MTEPTRIADQAGAGTFDAELAASGLALEQPGQTCNGCGHAIFRFGALDWRCDHGCRCLMLGCVPVRAKVEVWHPRPV